MTRGPAKSFDPDKVLDKVMLEFWKKGYAATSISDLREATGLGAKSLYDTYGGKRELFIASLERYGKTMVPREFDEVIASHPPAEAVIRILEKMVRVSAMGPARGCLLGVAAAGVERDPEVSAAVAKYLDHMQAALATAIANMPLKEDAPSPSELASMLMTLLQGVHLISRVDGSEKHTRASLSVVQRLIDECIGESK